MSALTVIATRQHSLFWETTEPLLIGGQRSVRTRVYKKIVALVMAGQDGTVHGVRITRSAVQYEVVIGNQRYHIKVFRARISVSRFLGGRGRSGRLHRSEDHHRTQPVFNERIQLQVTRSVDNGRI